MYRNRKLIIVLKYAEHRWPDILPKDTLLNGRFADGRFAEQTFCRTDSLTNGQFDERTTCRK
jgi:hypothetical protein